LRGIWHTLVRVRFWLGLAGAAFGTEDYAVMFVAGFRFVTDNPGWSAMITIYCFLVGLLFGGGFRCAPMILLYPAIEGSVGRRQDRACRKRARRDSSAVKPACEAAGPWGTSEQCSAV